MTILTTSTDPQTFKIILRDTPSAVTIVITDRNLGTSVTYTDNEPNYQYGWAEITETFALIEAREYVMEVSFSSDIIYRGLIYCTDQMDYSKYQMTSGSYVTSNDKSNDIVLF